jgi:hypothetical protein
MVGAHTRACPFLYRCTMAVQSLDRHLEPFRLTSVRRQHAIYASWHLQTDLNSHVSGHFQKYMQSEQLLKSLSEGINAHFLQFVFTFEFEKTFEGDPILLEQVCVFCQPEFSNFRRDISKRLTLMSVRQRSDCIMPQAKSGIRAIHIRHKA